MTAQRVRLIGSGISPHGMRVLVDGEPLRNVSRIEFDANPSAGSPVTIRLTLIGCDVDLEGVPEYLVKVVGPKPPALDRRCCHPVDLGDEGYECGRIEGHAGPHAPDLTPDDVIHPPGIDATLGPVASCGHVAHPRCYPCRLPAGHLGPHRHPLRPGV